MGTITRTCNSCHHRGPLKVVELYGIREYVCRACGLPLECDECGAAAGPGSLCVHLR